jgi:hypothetical protein
MILILVMYANQTVVVAINWYLEWLALFVTYSGSKDQAVIVYDVSEETPLTVLNIIGVSSLFLTVRLGIADSIMVFDLILYLSWNSNILSRSGAVGSFVTVAGN